GQSGRVLDLLHELVLEPLAARGHNRHSCVNDVVDVARREIADRGHDRIEYVLLKVFAAPMLDVGGGGAHRYPIGRQPIEIEGGRYDYARTQQATPHTPPHGLTRLTPHF